MVFSGSNIYKENVSNIIYIIKNIKCPDYDEFGDFIHQILVRDVDEYEPCKISDIRK